MLILNTHELPPNQSDNYYRKYAAAAAAAVAHLWEAPPVVHEYLTTLNPNHREAAAEAHAAAAARGYDETSAWAATNEVLHTKNAHEAATNTLEYLEIAIDSLDTQDDDDYHSHQVIEHLTLITNPQHLHHLANSAE